MRQAQARFEEYGLPFSESCWILAENGVSLLASANGMVTRKQPDYDFLVGLIEQGKIDTLHTWGDFPNGGFSRELASKGYPLLDKRVGFGAWTAHGGLNDLQNLAPLGQGDITESNYYHMDYTQSLGVRFFCRNIDIDVSRPSREVLLDGKYFRRFRGPPKSEAYSITFDWFPRQIKLAERRSIWHKSPDDVIIYTHFYAQREDKTPLRSRPAEDFAVTDATDKCLRELAERRDRGELEILRISDLLNRLAREEESSENRR